MIPRVTSTYLDVLKFLEELDPRHTTPTAKSVSFNVLMKIMSPIIMNFENILQGFMFIEYFCNKNRTYPTMG